MDAPGLYVSEEWPARYTLGTHRVNRLWVSTLYGSDAASRLHLLPVLCSGFTGGTRHAMLVYLRRMAEESRWRLSRTARKQLTKQLAPNVIRGFDQGIHNVYAAAPLPSHQRARVGRRGRP